MNYGEFINGGKEFRINGADLPRNWYNYMYTDSFVSFTSQTACGDAFLQDNMGRRIQIVSGRGAYLFTEDGSFCITGLPSDDAGENYNCIHGLGYTKIHSEHNAVGTEYLTFVPMCEDKNSGYEVHRISVINNTAEKQKIRVVMYIDTLLDEPYSKQGYNLGSIDFNKELNGFAKQINACWNGKETELYAGLFACNGVTGYDAARNAFIGPYGSLEHPRALKRGSLTDTGCIGEKFGFALESTVELEPKGTGTVTFIAGVFDTAKKITDTVKFLSEGENADKLLEEVKIHHERVRNGLHIDTPDEQLNCLFNYWLPYQTNMGSRWARVRHNGFRDMVSDTECLACFNPELAEKRIKRIMKYQYSNGYCPRTFINGEIKDNNFSDNAVWLTFAVYTIVGETGNTSLLNETVEFNDGTKATVYEHLKRAIDFLYNFKGDNGLIQIWGGDWNDCMNTAGLEHNGVSVWLSIAWYRANKQFSELAKMLGKTKDAEASAENGLKMRGLIEKYGWDGDYYIYAINDWGEKLGSKECDEGKVYLNPQTWAVLSGVCDKEKAEKALINAEKLLACPLGTRVSAPAYTHKNTHIGNMTEKPAGVHENGGVYLHAVTWKLAADAMLGRSEKVEQDINTILPWKNPIVNGRAEPYTLCNSYFGEETGYRYGTPGQSWRTASGQWFLKALVNFVFGITVNENGISVKPCLPPSWKRCELTKTIRGKKITFAFDNADKPAVTANGRSVSGGLIDWEEFDLL